MLGPFATASRYIAIHQVSLLSHAACASMSTTTTTTTTTETTRDIEWAQLAIMRQCTSVTDRRTDGQTDGH